MIIRDLWAHHLATAILPSSPASELPESAMNVADTKGATTTHSSSGLGIPDTPFDDAAEEESDTESNASRQDLEKELMRELSDEEEDGSAHVHEETEERSSHRGRKRKKVVISDTLVVLVTGLWVLRWPVVFTDIEWCVLIVAR
jgi:RNA polymerase I-specific transcription initiation factor RRN7